MLGLPWIVRLGNSINLELWDMNMEGISWSVDRPRVGLLSIGEEDTKGNEVTKEAFKYLKESHIHFIGNVEGRDVYSGNADVIVSDGFIGNVALKISEGLADAIKKMLMREIAQSTLGTHVVSFYGRTPLLRLRRKTDYAEFGRSSSFGC